MKKRLDVLLVERGFADTRSQAQAIIMAGQVSGHGRLLDKPGTTLDPAIELQVKVSSRYVSRAGEKLASVAPIFKLDFQNKVVLDVGSSTGGFTDFALQNGALQVYCVDVGTNQLAYKLRQDPRVIAMEKTDIREASLPEYADIAVIDVSFISLTKILESVAVLVKPDAYIVAMAKPQFEAGKELADKYAGVIPEGEEREQVLEQIRTWIDGHFTIITEADSGIAGAQGNLEHFFLLSLKR